MNPATNSSYTLTLGTNFAPASGIPSAYFDGFIDEVRLWDTCDPHTVNFQRNFQMPSDEPGLVQYYQLDDGIGAFVTESVKSGKYLVLGGDSAYVRRPRWLPSSAPLSALTVTDEDRMVTITLPGADVELDGLSARITALPSQGGMEISIEKSIF